MSISGDKLGKTMIGGTAAAALMVSVWLAIRGGPIPSQLRALAAVVFLTIESLATLGPWWLAAWGFGYPLRRAMIDKIPFAAVVQGGLGLAVMMWLLWVLGFLGLLFRGVAWGVVGVGCSLLLVQWVMLAVRRGLPKELHAPPLPWPLIVLAGPIGLMLVAAACPPGTLWAVEAFGYDVLTYHLQLPREWIANHTIRGLHHNVYSYLPSLVESGYAWLTLLHGGKAVDSVYVCQLFHVSMAAYAAIAVACLVANVTNVTAGLIAAAAMLATPWVVITGTLPYNEAAVLGFTAAAMLVALDLAAERWRGAVVVGILLGAAVLAKPTAGFMVVLPVAVLLLTRWNHVLPWRPPPPFGRGMGVAAIVAIAVILVVSPLWIRNGLDTGNPLFPFACRWLGTGHWTAELAARWDAAHGLRFDASLGQRASALARQWLFNTGYGAIGGAEQTREATNVATFEAGSGVPILWIAAAIGAALALMTRSSRRLGLAMLLLLSVQLLAWVTLTHLQSRFLLPTVLPGAVLVGLAAGRLDAILSPRRWWLMPSLAVFIVVSLTAASFNEFYSQTRGGQPACELVDSLQRGLGDHPINDLPREAHTLLVADIGPLLYLTRPITYATAFDPDPLGPLIRELGADPTAVTAALKHRGIDHVWIGWSELARLHQSYGHDPDVTEAWLRDAVKQWRIVEDYRHATLYALP